MKRTRPPSRARSSPTEAPHPRARDLAHRPTESIVRLLLDEEARAARVTAREAAPAIARAADLVARQLAAGGRVIYVGAGTSGRLGALDATELPPTFGLDRARAVAVIAGGPEALRRAVEGAEDDPAAVEKELAALRLSPRDVVIAIAASGTTPFTLAAVSVARSRRVPSVLITCAPPRGRVRADVEVRLPVGPEVIAGSTRLKAGTATKLALNAISTAAMVRLGKVWRGRMVGMLATNRKLDERARGILVDLTGVTRARAARLLEEADRDVKLALAMALTGAPVAEARRLLDEAGGDLDALASPARRA